MRMSINRLPIVPVPKMVVIGILLVSFVTALATPVSADPPPWAPAHGYRAMHKDNHGDHHEHKHKGKHKYKREYEDEHARAYVPPFDLGLGRCNRDVLGALIGGAGGAALGSTIGKGDGQTAAIIGGAILGIMVGGSIGRSMDNVDQNCIGQALEHAPDGRTIVWNNPANDAQYEMTPTRTVQVTDNRYCREYTTTAMVAGKPQQAYGRACRQPDGSWEIQN